MLLCWLTVVLLGYNLAACERAAKVGGIMVDAQFPCRVWFAGGEAGKYPRDGGNLPICSIDAESSVITLGIPQFARVSPDMSSFFQPSSRRWLHVRVSEHSHRDGNPYLQQVSLSHDALQQGELVVDAVVGSVIDCFFIESRCAVIALCAPDQDLNGVAEVRVYDRRRSSVRVITRDLRPLRSLGVSADGRSVSVSRITENGLEVVVLDGETGAVEWRTPGGISALSGDGCTLTVQTKEGIEVWRRGCGSAFLLEAVIAEGRVIEMCLDYTGKFLCLVRRSFGMTGEDRLKVVSTESHKVMLDAPGVLAYRPRLVLCED